jgi:hypothetical protein
MSRKSWILEELLMSFVFRRVLFWLGAVVPLGAAVLLSPSAAQASALELNPCNGAALTQPFAPWLDPGYYELAPGGDFELSSWTLAGGAQSLPGSETYAVTGTLGAWRLSLPAGASALSPTTCVDAAYPDLRMFITGSGSVAVNVVAGSVTIPAGVAVAAGRWQPTPVMLTQSALFGALSDGTANVQVQLVGLSGDPQVDDVFVDPWGVH